MRASEIIPMQAAGAHQPFLIADFTDGLSLQKEPWLSPKNAFRKLENARSFRGQLVKRDGYTRFGSLAEEATEQNWTTAPDFGSGSAFVMYTTSLPSEYWVPESIRATAPLGAASATITIVVDVGSVTPSPASNPSTWLYNLVNSGGSTVVGAIAFSWDPATSGYHQTVTIDWTLHPDQVLTSGNTTLHYRTIDDQPITGLVRFRNNDGDFTIAMNKERVFQYDATDGIFEPQGLGGAYTAYFTGTDDDYFWTWPGDDYLLMTNGVDPVHYWDPSVAVGSRVAEIATAWGGAGNELDTCRLVIRFRGRTLYFRTTESATVFPTRVRWTDAGSYTSIDALAFADAPATLGDIVTGGVIGNRIFIGFEQGWMELVATGDAVSPFQWEPLVSRFGAVSKLSTIQDNERLLSRGDTTMQAVDPNGQYYFDQKIPDLVKNFRSDKSDLSVGIRNEPQRSFWWTYVEGAETAPNNILVATYDEANNIGWSQYTNLPFNVFSEYESDQTPTWDSLGPLTWDDYSTVSWDDARVGVAGFTELIGGSRDGTVYQFGISATDNMFGTGRSSINMIAETQSLAPYPGQKAHLGWVDIYADAVANSSITLTFYVDSKSAAYKSVTLDLSSSDSSKVWRRIVIGKTGSFHRFRIETDTSYAVRIDAVVPYFRPAGRIREF